MRKKDALEDYLDGHEPIVGDASIATGTVLSGWRIVAFLGRGGSAEVYRVVHLSLPLQGALKILMRSEAAHIERFKRETQLLANLRHPAFPRFLGSGEAEGRPYMIMELLEPMELPRKDKFVANFLMSVAEGIKALHKRGIIHRDIKPQNIMRRSDGSPVIIDLGLAKKYSPLSRLQMPPTLSVVDGKRVGLGTPRYAAPEQFSGGEISPAADIHALGMLADECFGGKAPFGWTRIIRRCISSIPFLRYQSADDFIRAIKHRHWLRNVWVVGVVALVTTLVLLGQRISEPHDAATYEAEEIQDAWGGISENVTTNVVEEEILSKVWTTNEFGVVICTGRSYRNVTNEEEATIVRLANNTNVFDRQIILAPGRECWIEGPGVLDAELTASTNTIIRLRNCVFKNRTRKALDEGNLHYRLEGGTGLDFLYLNEPFGWRDYIY